MEIEEEKKILILSSWMVVIVMKAFAICHRHHHVQIKLQREFRIDTKVTIESITCKKKSMDSFGLQVSVSPVSSQLRKSECTSRDQEFQNYVVTFQAITKESLILKLTPFISILEIIKMGEVSCVFWLENEQDQQDALIGLDYQGSI